MPKMPTVSIRAGAVAARQALVFGRFLSLETDDDETEYLCGDDLPVEAGPDMRRNIRMPSFPIRASVRREVVHKGTNLLMWLSASPPEGGSGVAGGHGDGLVLSIDAGPLGRRAVDAFLDDLERQASN